MVKYPHTLKLLRVGEATQNPNGDIVPGQMVKVSQYPCRCEAANTADLHRGADGVSIQYSWVIYTERQVSCVPIAGDTIMVYDGCNNIAVEATVLKVLIGQFNVRIWV